MSLIAMAPVLSERDEAPGTEGGVDPLGLAAIADRLGTKLVPGGSRAAVASEFFDGDSSVARGLRGLRA